MMNPSAKRCGVGYLVGERGYSQRRGCALVKLARSSFRCLLRPWKDEARLTERKSKKWWVGSREVTLRVERPNQVCTYDFLEGRPEEGEKVRILTVLDEYIQECLAIVVDSFDTAGKVIGMLDWLFLTRGVPEHLRSNNGPKFVAKAVQKWLEEEGCEMIYTTLGSLWENPYIKSFNDKLREEYLNQHLVINVQEAQEVVEA